MPRSKKKQNSKKRVMRVAMSGGGSSCNVRQSTTANAFAEASFLTSPLQRNVIPLYETRPETEASINVSGGAKKKKTRRRSKSRRKSMTRKKTSINRLRRNRSKKR